MITDRISLVRLLLLSFGLIYLWFGMLKFFPGMSPAEMLSGETISMLTLGLLSSAAAVKVLAVLEVGIGLACILGIKPEWTIRVILFHMVGTFTPFFLMPEQIFGEGMFSLTLVGQYIIKNLVFVSALMIAYKAIGGSRASKSDKGYTTHMDGDTKSMSTEHGGRPRSPQIVIKASLDE